MNSLPLQDDAGQGSYRALFDACPVGLLREDTSGRVLEVNPRLAELLGRESSSELEGVPVRTLYERPDDVARTRSAALKQGRTHPRDVQLLHPDGSPVWVQETCSRVPGRSGSTPEVLRTFVDVTERRNRERDLTELAYHDSLTGSANRRLLEIRADQTLALAERRGYRAAVVFLDLVEFKRVNDRLGHTAGDELLIRTARRLEGSLRDADTVGRWGGDEFAVLLSEVEDREAALQTAHRLLERVVEPVGLGEETVELEARAGVAIFPEDGDSFSTLLSLADGALLAAKSGVRDVVSA